MCREKSGLTLWDPCPLLISHRYTHRLVGPPNTGMPPLPFLSSLACLPRLATATPCVCLLLPPGLLVSSSPWMGPHFLERKAEIDTDHGPALVPHGGKKSGTHLSPVITASL